MITGNTHFAIAVHVLTAISFHDKPVTSGMLASSVNTNSAFLRSILSRLREQGLIQTKLGKGGGSLLARAATDITLLDIYRATDGKAELAAHCCKDSTCWIAGQIPGVLDQLNADLDQAMAKVLRAKTLADVATGVQQQGPQTTS